MIVTSLFVYLLQLVHGSSVVEQYQCEFHLKIIIRKFHTHGCRWPGAIPCLLHDAHILGWKTVNLFNRSHYELTVNLPGMNSELRKLILEVSNYLPKTTISPYCQFEIMKNYNGSQQWEGQFNDTTRKTNPCFIDVIITSTFQCPSTTKPSVINISTVQTHVMTRFNSSNVRMTSSAVDKTSASESTPPFTKEKLRAVSMVGVWYITISIGYFIAGVIVAVEVCYCCKMYQRARSFPWCRVRMPRAKANKQDTEHNNEVDRSVTLSLEPKQPPKDQDPSSTTQTVWIENDSQKNK